MPRMTPATNRFDPYRNYRFKIKWDGSYVAAVSKMTALKRSTEIVEWREAGENITSRKLPGKTKYDDTPREGGVPSDTFFSGWPDLCRDFGSHSITSLGQFRKNLTLD